MPVDHGESEPLLGYVQPQPDETLLDTNFHPDAPIMTEPNNSNNPSPPDPIEVSDTGGDTDTSTDTRPKRIHRLVNKIPRPVRRVCGAAVRWTRGPPDARPWHIVPILPVVQEFPLRLLDRYVPRHKHHIWLFLVYCGFWFMTFALVFRSGTFATEVEGWGVPGNLGCGSTYWVSGNRCGLDGNDCRPFNGSGFAFRCPANCASYEVLNPRAVGDQEIIYQPLVIGGPQGDTSDDPVYRGDSFICGAAIHSGIIDNQKGGCGVVALVGQTQEFVGSSRNGISSVGFNSYFPLSFTFVEGVECNAQDMRWSALGVTLSFSIVLSLFTASPAVFFFTIFTALFWHVGMASDPPAHRTVAALISNLMGKFLPGMFVAYVMYDKMGIRRTLTGLTAQVEKTLLWLGACWVGALNNYTFGWIPIQRLTPHDIDQQPGAKLALALIIIVLALLTMKQIWFFRQEGRLIKYLELYALMGASLLIFVLIPELGLRIHHYILALLLLPGTSMQTRPALVYQGLLVGLFINGIARWGFDSVLQTAYDLQGDAVHNSPLPVILEPVIELASNLSSITFRWMPPPGPRYDGISVLVNDVERFRSYFDEEGEDPNFLWQRTAESDVNEYFRFGYMEGSRTWDYTKAGVWDNLGEWNQMPPGPSKVKVKRHLEEESDSMRVRARRQL